MRNATMKTLLLIAGLMAAPLALADVYVCDVDGAKVFTDKPCHADAEAHMEIEPDPVPDPTMISILQPSTAAPAPVSSTPGVLDRQRAVNDAKARKRAIDRQFAPMLRDIDRQIAETEKQIADAGEASVYFGGDVRRDNAGVIGGLQAKLGSLRQTRAQIVIEWSKAANNG